MPNDKIAFNFPDLNIPKNLTDSVLPSDANSTSAMPSGLLPNLSIKVYYGKTPGHYFAQVFRGDDEYMPILAGSLQGFLQEIAGYCNNEAPQP
jgi:hypothetical protein